MKRLLAALSLGLALAASTTVQAGPIVWQYDGVFDEVNDAGGAWTLPPDIAAGKSFSLRVSFDSLAQLLGKGAGGTRYNFSNATLGMHLDAGAVSGDFDNDWLTAIIVRDNSPAPVPPGSPPGPLVDGITFQVYDLFADQIGDQYIGLGFALTLRTSNLDGFNVSGDAIPTSPFPLIDMTTNGFHVCRFAQPAVVTDTSPLGSLPCDFGEVSGHVLAVSVIPEPTSLALCSLGLGLALGLRRRRPR